jgi:hypothetical protein
MALGLVVTGGNPADEPSRQSGNPMVDAIGAADTMQGDVDAADDGQRSE